MTAADVTAAPAATPALERPCRRSLLLVALLMPVGPACVAVLRYLLPYFTAADSAEVVAAAGASPAQQSAVLWLGYVAVLTLVPGVLAAGQVTRDAQPVLTNAALCLLVPAYLSTGTLLSGDALLWAGSRTDVDSETLVRLYDAMHPATLIGMVVFVVGHVVGTVLLGLALLRSRRVPATAAWALTLSQPLHFVATVVLGSRELDLFAWSLTAFGMGSAGWAWLRLQPARSSSSRCGQGSGAVAGTPDVARSAPGVPVVRHHDTAGSR